MKRLFTLITMLLAGGMYSYAQAPKVAFTYAGTGASGYTGDGGLATNATLKSPGRLACDALGNVYVSDSNYVIRKINAVTGVITTVAGNGIIGYSGDGGPAVNASIGLLYSMIADSSGNLFFTDGNSYRVRKVDAISGIISTVAGNGSGIIAPPSDGDGGPAVNANLNMPYSLAIDNTGNLYIGSYNGYQVRKVNLTTGIISTVAGTGIPGHYGDGGPAINAQIGRPTALAVDPTGNLYIGDADTTNMVTIANANIIPLFPRIRKVDATTGIITTIAGGGISTINYVSNTGTIATNAQLSWFPIFSLAFDNNGNLLIPQFSFLVKLNFTNGRIYSVCNGSLSSFTEGIPVNILISLYSDIASNYLGEIYFTSAAYNQQNKVIKIVDNNFSGNGFSRFINMLCSGPQFCIVPMQSSPNLHVVTWFGDGDSISSSFIVDSTFTSFTHVYAYSGTYTIKHVLYNGTIALDSQEYSYNYTFCRTLPIRLYYDINGNCTYDGADHLLGGPTTIEIDSNGIAKDTISIISGMDYSANGNPGDIYQFKAINTATGLTAVCPSWGVIVDTLNAGNNVAKYLGFHCAGATGFDLSVNSNVQMGRHTQQGQIIVQNGYCSPENGVVTVNKSPQLAFTGAYPVPSSVNGDSITWNINNLSSAYTPVTINYRLDVPTPWNQATWLNPGDTVHSAINITPITGDINTANNTNIRIDTVKSSFDPNEMDVSPRPYIQAGDQLQYTIQFENTGNDTAQNISVLDTLPNSLNIHTLAMVASTHSCIFSKKWTGSKWVAKFDFPNIKLLDSSHHNQCTGMLVFNIKAKTGLAAGTYIFNHAAIFFDDNPPVITDTVVDIIIAPTSVVNANKSVVSIYPNPATQLLHIDNLKEATSYRIVNMVGGTVIQGVLSQGNNEIRLEAIPAGVYILQLTYANGQREVIRVVKE
jgi:uncharacterized repeat protein (TIGR01451 family)